MSPSEAWKPDLVLRAPCKVNLTLEVLGKRPDGYYEIRTVMQAVDLCDELEFVRLARPRVTLSCDRPGLPIDEDNLVVRAARLLQDRCGARAGVAVRLRKRVPIGGGLGGGSSDAAVTLLALNDLWGLGLSLEELRPLAAELGSDVPFFLWGGRALCEGRGELVTPMDDGPPLHFVLVMPGLHVATGAVYAAAGNALTSRAGARNNVSGDRGEAGVRPIHCVLRNDLQGPALAVEPELRSLQEGLMGLAQECRCKGLLLCGSGSSYLMLMGDHEAALKAVTVLGLALGVPCTAARSDPAWGGRISMLTAGRGEA